MANISPTKMEQENTVKTSAKKETSPKPKKRKRRTKAEIEADKAEKAAAVKPVYPVNMIAVLKKEENAPEAAYFNPSTGEWFFHESQAVRNFGPGNYEKVTL